MHTNAVESRSSLALRAVENARPEEHAPEGVDAEDAVKALRLALHAADVTLPDLGADGCTCGRFPAPVLVELGCVRGDVALRLAEVVAKGAAE